MSVLSNFRLIAPEFSTMLDADVNEWIDLIVNAQLIDVSCLSPAAKQDLATALYTAHLIWLSTYKQSGSGVTGNIRSEREGDLSRSYGALTGDADWLGQSPYGLQYKQITNACFGATIMTRRDVPSVGVN